MAMTPIEGRLHGRIAAVTGAGLGIGRASALCFADEGADLMLLDRDGAALEATAEAARQRGRRVEAYALDATDEAAVVGAFASVRERLGDIDILLNNVGQSARERSREFWESEPATWRFVVDASLFPTLLCSRQVVPLMRARRSGKIVNIASDAALLGSVGQAEYAAAKAGVIGFTRTLARELAPFGVNVNAICPGPIRTRALDLLPQDRMGAAIRNIPMQRVGEPVEIGRVAVFLGCGDSDYITGQSIVVDGGRWMV